MFQTNNQISMDINEDMGLLIMICLPYMINMITLGDLAMDYI